MKFPKFKLSWPVLAILIVSGIIIAFIVFNNNGAIKYAGLRTEHNKLETRIDSSNQQIKLLKRQIDSLKNNAAKIEKIAREKYNMKNSNEKVIKVKTTLE